jgi:hypothetical protein
MSETDEKLQSLLAFIQENGRVCPRPIDWQDFWESLPAKQQTNEGWEPPLPIVLDEWWGSTDEQKAERFREHVTWAAQHHALDAADTFLRALPDLSWHCRLEHQETED